MCHAGYGPCPEKPPIQGTPKTAVAITAAAALSLWGPTRDHCHFTTRQGHFTDAGLSPERRSALPETAQLEPGGRRAGTQAPVCQLPSQLPSALPSLAVLLRLPGQAPPVPLAWRQSWCTQGQPSWETTNTKGPDDSLQLLHPQGKRTHAHSLTHTHTHTHAPPEQPALPGAQGPAGPGTQRGPSRSVGIQAW